MATKRTADALEAPTSRHRRQPAKRARLSPTAEERTNSSEPSSCSVSEDSALQSSPPASPRQRVSSMSSLETADSVSDSESSSSSDSESDLSESDEDDIVTIGAPKKPNIQRMNTSDGQQDLKARIAALLPQLEKANSLLTSEGEKHSMEDVEDGEQHIEMNLGLGVLEERDEEGSDSSDESEASSDDDDDDASALPISSGVVKSSQRSEAGVMDALTGRRSRKEKAGIEEVG